MKCFKGQKTFVFFFEHLIVNFHNKILSMDFQDKKQSQAKYIIIQSLQKLKGSENMF